MRRSLRGRTFALALALLGAAPLAADSTKWTEDQRIALIRGLSSEYATVKVALPRSKKALKFDSNGKYDRTEWADAGREFGPAARVGDLVQISRIQLAGDQILLEINGGFKSGRGKWYQRIQIGGGMGGGATTVPIAQGQSNAPGGTSIALLFHGSVPPLKPEQIKKLLAPILDFEKHSATESYVDSLPPEIKKAVTEKRAMVGMDRDQVLLALGKPVRKVRESKDGVETEDWIFGQPPGKIVFVTFNGNKVIKVREDYAGLGTEAPQLAPPR